MSCDVHDKLCGYQKAMFPLWYLRRIRYLQRESNISLSFKRSSMFSESVCGITTGAGSSREKNFQQECLNIFTTFPNNMGGGEWSNSQGKNRRAGPLCLLELFGSPLNLAKFHPSWRDGMYHLCLVL